MTGGAGLSDRLRVPRRQAEKFPAGTKAVSRAIEVLCCFNPAAQEWGITEMGDYLGYSKSVVHRLLSALERDRLVERTDRHRYRLGIRALELGQTYRAANPMVWHAEPRLTSLAKRVNAVVHLAILAEGRDVLELARSCGDRPLVLAPHPSFRMPAHATALGKVLLAHSSPETRERYLSSRPILPALTEHTIRHALQLRSHLERVAAVGYAVDNEECTAGLRCLAIPVLNDRGSLVAALSISRRSDLFEEEELFRLLKDLLTTARSLLPTGRADYDAATR
jgi:DNA-binding IclR family transcriptional regulator